MQLVDAYGVGVVGVQEIPHGYAVDGGETAVTLSGQGATPQQQPLAPA
ncbi:hypothetical protein [Rhodococcus sp. 14-2483-1-2]|nr:hypothetical protein [Rhodococcus sp. 14-2483-1-2]